MDATRKLAAIMFTDIVGYSAMMSQDEKQAMNILEKNRTIHKSAISRYRGKYIKEIGDGTLTIFHSSLDAVNCTKEIQKNCCNEPSLSVRIGLHIGDIIFKDNDVFGDGVNIASRIVSEGVPGGVYISDRVFEDIKNKPGMKAVFVGERMLKNISEPVKIYNLISDSHLKKQSKQQTGNRNKEKSIAVLPFTDMSEQKNQEYFCEGMAEELINTLAHVTSLQVASRTSAFQLKGKGLDIREIGDKLNLQSVLEGSIRKAGNKLRITAKLVNVSNGYHIWSEKYDRDLEDVFAIQDEISLAIVDNLKIKLLKKEKNKLAKHHTDNKEAHNLYLKGRYFWNRRTDDGFTKALGYFYNAIKIDPQYALPYIGIADTYNISGNYCFIPPHEAYSNARNAVIKALEIDKNIGEAHSSLAWILAHYDHNWMKAEKEYKRSIELNPEYATAHEWYAILLSVMGRYDEALTQIKVALELDPLSAMINAIYGGILIFVRRFDDAIVQLQKTIEINPDFSFAHIWLGGAHLGKKDFHKALESLLKSETIVKDMTFGMGILGLVYAFDNQEKKALKVLNRMEELSKNKYVSPLHKAYVYIGLNNKDKAFELMNLAYTERDPWLIYIKILTLYDSLRSDKRYIKLVKKLGLEA